MARVQELLRREVINLFSGEKLGFATDIEIDTETGRIDSLILPEKGKGMSLFNKQSDLIVPWSDIQRISDDLIMINTDTGILRRQDAKS